MVCAGDLGRVGVEVDLDDLEYHPFGTPYEGSVLDEGAHQSHTYPPFPDLTMEYQSNFHVAC
jgi:hypothetical protein